MPIAHAVGSLNPGYFALVMATGIVSVGMNNNRQTALSGALMVVAAACYAVLVVLTCWRIAFFRVQLRADVGDPGRAFGFLTFVAGTDVLGTRFGLAGQRSVALTLLVIGWVSWVVLGYLVPWLAVLGRRDHPVLADANGTWFIWVVASQSVAVISAALEPGAITGRRELALLAVFSWSVGVFLYAAQGIFVAARLLLDPVTPSDLTPPYWVAMGATAITVLAGARIVQMSNTPIAAATHQLIAGASVVFWAFGSWLIPALLAAGVWRHVIHRLPLRYDASWWSIVFPLGMYGVASYYLGRADHLTVISAIGQHELWIALIAWVLAFVAMVVHLIRSLLLPHRLRLKIDHGG